MGAIDNLLNAQLTILILILMGYALAKFKLLNAQFRKYLTDLVINFILPCNIITSFMMEFNNEIMRACLAVFVVSAVMQVVIFLLGKVLYLRAKADQIPSLQYSTMVSNGGFLGNPIVESLCGPQGLLYASIYLIPQRIMMWSVGVSYFTGTKGEGVLKKVLTHPCIIAVEIGLVLMVTQLQLPVWLDKPLSLVGNCNTPVSLIVIGGILAEVDPRNIISKSSLYFSLIRLVAIPLAVLGGCLLTGVDQMAMEVSTILAGMPAPLTTAILASKYGSDEKFAVSLVFLTTVLSMVTIPLLCLLMMVC